MPSLADRLADYSLPQQAEPDWLAVFTASLVGAAAAAEAAEQTAAEKRKQLCADDFDPRTNYGAW